MASVFAWVKNIIFFYIIMTAVMYLLPKNKYQKYVKFFGGLLLVVMIVTPLLELLYEPAYLLNKISYESFWQEMGELQLDVEKMEQVQQQAYKREYELAIGNDIKQMAQEEHMLVNEIQVKLTEECTVEQVWMSLCLSEQKPGIYVEKIAIEDNSQEYPKVWQLKKKIKEFYQLTDNQIQITVKEG